MFLLFEFKESIITKKEYKSDLFHYAKFIFKKSNNLLNSIKSSYLEYRIRIFNAKK